LGRVAEHVTRPIVIALTVVVTTIGIVTFTGNSDSRITEVPVEPASLYDPIVAGEEFPGGIRWVISRDGIRPIYEPEFVSAEISLLENEDLVIGVSIGGEARAYGVGLLAAREIVNDWIADVPIVVSWCPLCGTGTVHRREIDDKPVLFGNQGALWGNAMTWWDHQTGSIWSQPLGEAIAGPFKGRRLELLPSTLTTWSAWKSEYPNTRVLDGPVYASGPNDSEFAVVVEISDQAVAYPIGLISERGVVNDVVGNVPVAVVADLDGLWAVFSRSVDGSIIDLALDGDTLVDESSGSEWEAFTGLSRDRNSHLVPIPASTVFPKDFPTFWPEGRLFSG